MTIQNTFTESKEHIEEGKKAFLEGKAIQDNPYKELAYRMHNGKCVGARGFGKTAFQNWNLGFTWEAGEQRRRAYVESKRKA